MHVGDSLSLGFCVSFLKMEQNGLCGVTHIGVQTRIVRHSVINGFLLAVKIIFVVPLGHGMQLLGLLFIDASG